MDTDSAHFLVKILRYNKVKFAKLTDLMEQKFSTAVAISERLIHTAYSNRLSPGALDHEALIAVVKYVNDIWTLFLVYIFFKSTVR